MSCIVDAQVNFNVSGIKIQPYSVDFRSNKQDYDYARIEVSREAGDLIEDKAVTNEPVDLLVSGNRRLRPMYFPAGALEHADDVSYIKLMDSEHVLTMGVCDKYFERVTLKDAVQYVMSKTQDPNGVVRSWDLTDPDYSDNVTEDYRKEMIIDDVAEGVGSVTGGNELFLDKVEEFVAWTARQSHEYVGMWREEGGFDFDQDTPAQAFQKIAEEFELEYWVDDERRLWLGKRDMKPSLHIVNGNDDTIAISEYNVHQAAYPVAEVIVKGGKPRLDRSQDETNAVRNQGVKTWGQARVNDVENGTTVTKDQKKLRQPESVKKAAERLLIQEMMKNKSGNLVLNPEAVGYTAYANPHKLSVGDYVQVSPPPDCAEDYDSGRFQINSVHHKIRGSDGWEVTVDVAHIPTRDIQSRFFYYNTESEEIVTEDDVYFDPDLRHIPDEWEDAIWATTYDTDSFNQELLDEDE